jgi:hypothetical protein
LIASGSAQNFFDIERSGADGIQAMFATKDYSARGAGDALKPFSFERGDLVPNDVHLWRRLRPAGSWMGGIVERQEVLDHCAERGITSDIEMIAMDSACDRMLKSVVKYRFVIDIGTLK